MTREEVEIELKEILNGIKNKEKKDFLKQLKAINKETDKLDKTFKNILDNIKFIFTINIDKKILNLIYDIAENIEDERLDNSIRVKIENIIISFLSKDLSDTSQDNAQINSTDKGKERWEETKKVRKAL